MAKTSTVTFDNLSAHALVVPFFCRQVTLREQASGFTSDYWVSAPSSSDSQFPKLPAESTVFSAAPGSFFQANDVVGYIQPIAGTMTFSLICE